MWPGDGDEEVEGRRRRSAGDAREWLDSGTGAHLVDVHGRSTGSSLAASERASGSRVGRRPSPELAPELDQLPRSNHRSLSSHPLRNPTPHLDLRAQLSRRRTPSSDLAPAPRRRATSASLHSFHPPPLSHLSPRPAMCVQSCLVSCTVHDADSPPSTGRRTSTSRSRSGSVSLSLALSAARVLYEDCQLTLSFFLARSAMVVSSTTRSASASAPRVRRTRRRTSPRRSTATRPSSSTSAATPRRSP